MRRPGYWSPPPPALPGLPELAYVGRIATNSAARIGAHRHDNWELCLVERGRTQWIVAGRSVAVRGGDLVVIPPHALHDGWQAGRYRFLGFRPRRGSGLLGLPRAQALRAIAGLRSAAARPTPSRIDIRAPWTRLERAWREGGATSSIAARGALLEILAAVAGEADVLPPPSPIVQQALAAFAASDVFMPIDALARRLRCSPTHLKTAFREQTGLPPGEYHRRQRIARAWRELRLGRRSVVDIALAYGFPSSQHFATAFKRLTGMTPSAARSASPDSADGGA